MRAALDEERRGRTTTGEGGSRAGRAAGSGTRGVRDAGYHGTRVDDVVEAAGVSHGAFYRYFKNKDELAHLLAAQAMRTVSSAFLEIPDTTKDGASGRAALRRWLRAYNQAQVERGGDDPGLGGRRPPGRLAPGRTRRRCSTGAVAAWPNSCNRVISVIPKPTPSCCWPSWTRSVCGQLVGAVDAAASIIERGFLGR